MPRVRLPYLRAGVLVMLIPALLLLPVLHLHPASAHAHGTEGAHEHRPVIHADFFPDSAHAHGEHYGGHGVPDDSSTHPLSQIRLFILLPRSPVLLLPALQRVLVSLRADVPVLSSPFSFHTWFIVRDHSPPVQNISFPLASPRSPPRLV